MLTSLPESSGAVASLAARKERERESARSPLAGHVTRSVVPVFLVQPNQADNICEFEPAICQLVRLLFIVMCYSNAIRESAFLRARRPSFSTRAVHISNHDVPCNARPARLVD